MRHLLWEIAEGEGYEKLKQIAQKPLTGVKIAPFYGCQILRPSKLLGFEDPDRPQSLERIIEACGAEPVDYPSKIKCCGFPIVLAREEVALGELIQPLAEAKAAGADAMVTPCPLCHLSLDAWQGKAEPRGRHRVRPADLPPGPAGRRGRRPVVRRPALQAPRHEDVPGDGQDLRGGRLRGQVRHPEPWHPRNAPVTPSYAALFRAPYTALMVAALGATFLGSLDALMVTTALPSAAQDIGGVDLIAVTVGATTVAVAMTFPVAGAVIDREGVGRSFAIACSLFAVANVLGGLAPSMPVIAVSRAILGLGAGFMFAVPLGLFAVSLPDELRPRAFGINAAMWGVSALIGPALGAVLTATVGWRWVFWINLPLIAIVAWSAARALRGGSPVGAAGERGPLQHRRPGAARARRRRAPGAHQALAAAARCWRPWRCFRPRRSSSTSGGRSSPSSRTPPTRSPRTSRPSGPGWRSSAPRPTCRSSSRWGSTTASASSASRSSSARSDGRPAR